MEKSKISILVVEDDISSREIIRNFLIQLGHKAAFVETGYECIEYCHNHTADIIFMDLVMPGLNGFETAKAVRLDPNNKDAYIIAFTSYDSEDIFYKCMEVGMNDFIQKPICLNILDEKLNNIVLERKSA